MCDKTARRGFACAVLVLALAGLAARPATAAPPAEPAKPADTPLVVDGTHLPGLEDINSRLLKNLPAPTAPQLDAAKATPPIGSDVMFWSWDFATGAFYPVTATLQAIGQNVELYVDKDTPLAPGTIADIARVADAAVLREHQAFGTEPSPGTDGNRRVTILLLDIRDSQYDGVGGGMVGGYFWYLNEYTQSTIDHWYPGSGLKSNEREIIFVDELATMPGTRPFYQVLTHEFQHMIQWNYDPDEDGWLNEGSSNLAAQLTGFGLPEYHVQAFLNNPNKTLTRGGDNVFADYGGYGLFSLYLWENYGGDAFSRDLESSPAHGTASVDSILAKRGYTDRFPQVLSHWAVANFLDDATVYGYRALAIGPRGVNSEADFYRPPLTAARTAYPTGPVSTTVAAWGANYLTFRGFGQGDLALTLTAGINANFTVNVITSTSNSFATGTNVLREVALRAGTSVAVRLPGAGATFSNVLVIPVHVSQIVDWGGFSCEASVIARPTPTPLPMATPVASPTPAPSYVKRIDSGGKGLTDSLGQTWAADVAYTRGGAGYVGGVGTTMMVPIALTLDGALYQTERYGLSAYMFDVPNGTYSVPLSFSENYFVRAGSRLFDVLDGNQTVLANFDIFKAAGGRYRSYDWSFASTVTNGQLVVGFVNRKGTATIQGIAVQSVAP